MPLPESERLNVRVLALAGAGKNAEALALAERVLELRRQTFGADSEPAADAHMTVAVLSQRLGKRDKAESHYRKSLAVYEKGNEQARGKATVVLDNLALLAPTLPAAVSLHERNLALKEKLFGPESAEVSMTLFPLAHLYEFQGGVEKAERLLRRFVKVREQTPVGSPDDRGVALFRLDCLLRKRGREGEAADFARQAEEVFESQAAERGELRREDTIDGRVVSKPAPGYPAEAKRNREYGTVPVRVLVGENGRVLAACGESNYRALNRASEMAAYEARFTPTLVRGKPVKVRGLITYHYVAR